MRPATCSPLVVLFAAAAAGSGCGGSSTTATKKVTPKKPPPITSIAEVDFENRGYVPSCLSGKRVVVEDGERVIEDGDNRLYFSATVVSTGDLTGDGADEALVLTLCNTGGTGQWTEGELFSVKDGALVRLAVLPTGDRADGGIAEAWILNNELVVERFGHGPDEGACCPEWIERQRFTWNGTALVAAGEPERRTVEAPAPDR